jgi:hypothetical protein
MSDLEIKHAQFDALRAKSQLLSRKYLTSRLSINYYKVYRGERHLKKEKYK